MNNEVLFCEGCEEFFETTEDMASTIRQLANDPDFNQAVLCDACTLIAFQTCYRCGSDLRLDESDICYQCACDELDEEQQFFDDGEDLYS